MQLVKSQKNQRYAGSSTTWHKSQVFFYILSAFLLGVLMASLFNFPLSLTLVILIVAISTILLAGFKNKPLLLVSFFMIAFAIGGARFNSFSGAENNLDKFVGQKVALNGYVDDQPEVSGNIQRFALSSKGSRVLVTTNAYPRYKFGDIIEVSGELELPQNFTDFDYVTYLKKDGIRTVLFFSDVKNYDQKLSFKLQEKFKLSLYKNIFKIKDLFENSVNASIPEPNAAFINGILLGTRQNIPDELKDAFSKTGTTHILAISGYNIMIISWAVLSGLIWFFKRRTAFWISVAVIILFVILTGASASVVRAALMGLLLSFANGYGRLYEQKNSIILAGAAMVWINPFVLVFDIGFQLSFAAVMGLIYIYPLIEAKFNGAVPILFSTKSKLQNRGSSISQLNLNNLGEIGSGFKELVLMTLSAQIAVSPLLVYYFRNISLVALPTNILILPFIPVAMLTGFITGLAGMVYLPIGQVIGYSAWAITSYQIWVVRLLS